MARTVVVAAPQRVVALDGAVELVLGRMACARFEDGSVRCSDEHDALLDTRFIEVEALRGHQLRDGGSTLVGFKDNEVLFLGSYGQRSAELPSPIEDLVSREGVTCVLLGGGEVWCTPPGVEFTFERDQPPEAPARLGSDGDAVCAISAQGSASCRTFGTRWDSHPSPGKISRIEGDLGGTCRVVGSDTICDTTPSGWSTKVGAMPANAVTRLSGIEIEGAAFGAEHRCILQPDRRVACWGSGEHGQLGTGALDTREDPTPIADLTGVKTIDVRSDSSCALTEGGQVWCWGAVGGKSALELNELDATWARALR